MIWRAGHVCSVARTANQWTVSLALRSGGGNWIVDFLVEGRLERRIGGFDISAQSAEVERGLLIGIVNDVEEVAVSVQFMLLIAGELLSHLAVAVAVIPAVDPFPRLALFRFELRQKTAAVERSVAGLVGSARLGDGWQKIAKVNQIFVDGSRLNDARPIGNQRNVCAGIERLSFAALH